MTIIIDGVEIDIGSNVNYPQTNPTTGVSSDKVKFRLTQQNNKVLTALLAIADMLSRLSIDVDMTHVEYIWAADDNTIMAADDDTILMFRTDMESFILDVQDRLDAIEQRLPPE